MKGVRDDKASQQARDRSYGTPYFTLGRPVCTIIPTSTESNKLGMILRIQPLGMACPIG